MRASSYDQLLGSFRDQGDILALARLFDLTAPDLYRLAIHLGRDAATADDLVQSTFLKAIEGVGNWRGDGGARAYLCGILVNEARHWLRARARGAAPLVHEPAARDGDPARDSASREVNARLDAAVATLPDPYREVLSMELATGAGPAEIARRLGRRPATVRSQLHRGLDLLRRVLPTGLAAWLFGVLCPVPALAAIRPIVLAHAVAGLATAPVASVGVGLTSGALIMKKLVVVFGVVLAALIVATPFWIETESESDLDVRTEADEGRGGAARRSPEISMPPADSTEPTTASAKASTKPLQTTESSKPGWWIRARVGEPTRPQSGIWELCFAEPNDYLHAFNSSGMGHVMPDVFAIEDLEFGLLEEVSDGQLLEWPGGATDERPCLVFAKDEAFGELHLPVTNSQWKVQPTPLTRSLMPRSYLKGGKSRTPLRLRARCFSRDGLVWKPVDHGDRGALAEIPAGTVFEAAWPDGVTMRFRPVRPQSMPEQPEWTDTRLRFVDALGGQDVTVDQAYQFFDTKGDSGVALSAGPERLWPVMTLAKQKGGGFVRVHARGYLPARVQLKPTRKRRTTVVTIPLLPHSARPCRVLDFAGRPLPQARVEVRQNVHGYVHMQGKSDEEGGVLLRAVSPWPQAWFAEDEVCPLITIVGEDGAIGSLCDVSLASLVRGCDLRLTAPAHALVVRVVDSEGRPVRGHVLAETGPDAGDGEFSQEKSAMILEALDLEGRARLGPLHAQRVDLRITGDGRLPHDLAVDLLPDESEQLIQLPSEVQITGQVVDSLGTPISRARLFLQFSRQLPPAERRRVLAQSDEAGRFRFSVPPDGEVYDVSIDASSARMPNAKMAFAVPSEYRACQAGQDLKFELRTVVQATFRIEREDGQAVGGVEIRWADDPAQRSDDRRPRWRREFGGPWFSEQSRVPLFEGEMRLSFQAPGCHPLVQSVRIREADEPIAIRLRLGPWVQGRLSRQDAGGATPASQLSLVLVDVPGFSDLRNAWRFVGRLDHPMTPDENGVFRIGPLTPGRYEIRRGSSWNGEVLRSFVVNGPLDLGDLGPM